jgi:serine/threonine-protein kinase RsbW
MLCQRLESCQLEIVPHAKGEAQWCWETVASAAEMAKVIQTVLEAMTVLGYPETEIFAVHLSLEESLVNAQKHGHQGSWGPPITVRYHVNFHGVVFQVEDQGPGFQPDQVPDPLAEANLERPSGRGLLLMRSYMSSICHNQMGNCICLCKHRRQAVSPG